ncbi:MAG: hypothetical protein JXA10_15465 [Anaerolineae bacterium]|nr:hypothetical protein [Anaerolineae bacterium]
MNSSPDGLIEFTVPFDLENCRQRLDNRHERATFFAWDWQRRTHVKTRQTAPDTVEFTLKRIEKNDWFSWGSLAVVRGVMRELGSRQTVIIARPQIAYFWIFAPFVIILFAVAGMAIGVVSDPNATEENLPLMMVIFAVIGLGSLAFTWWWAHAQLQHLIGTLKEALGQWM